MCIIFPRRLQLFGLLASLLFVRSRPTCPVSVRSLPRSVRMEKFTQHINKMSSRANERSEEKKNSRYCCENFQIFHFTQEFHVAASSLSLRRVRNA